MSISIYFSSSCHVQEEKGDSNWARVWQPPKVHPQSPQLGIFSSWDLIIFLQGVELLQMCSMNGFIFLQTNYTLLIENSSSLQNVLPMDWKVIQLNLCKKFSDFDCKKVCSLEKNLEKLSKKNGKTWTDTLPLYNTWWKDTILFPHATVPLNSTHCFSFPNSNSCSRFLFRLLSLKDSMQLGWLKQDYLEKAKNFGK